MPAEKDPRDYWEGAHDRYSGAEWIDKPSIFATQVQAYIPNGFKVLELGGGQGQDARFFAAAGCDVVLTDLAGKALEYAERKMPETLRPRIQIREMDISQPFPFPDSSFDAVYSHLSMHYFDTETTQRIFDEAFRVLRPGGVFAALANSTNDPEYDLKQEIEEGLTVVHGIRKRFFTTTSMASFGSRFEAILVDDKGETYKDRAINTANLIRFVGRKPAV